MSSPYLPLYSALAYIYIQTLILSRNTLLCCGTLVSYSSYLASREYAKFLELFRPWESSDLSFLLACTLLLA